MNKIRWMFMSKYKKLLYSIKCAQENNQRLHLSDDLILDFSEDMEKVVRCRECMYCRDNGKLCIRKIKSGGIRAADRVYPSFYCKAGKRKEQA